MAKKNLFSSRTQWPFESNPLMKALQAFKDNSTPFLDLTESNPTRCHFRYPKEIVAAFNNPHNFEYKPLAAGQLNSRQAISRYYEEKGFDVRPEQIILTASTSEAYSYLFRLLLNPNDQVLISSPSYPLFQLLVELNDGHLVSYPLHYNQGWSVDLKALRKLIRSKARAIIAVNPNNPTGSLLSQLELEEMNQSCAEQQAAFICDEVFSDYWLEPRLNRMVSCVNQKKVLTFVLGGISKTLGLPQMKLSWIVVNGPTAQVQSAIQRLEMIADTYLSVNTPAQNALEQWLSLRGPIQTEILQRLRANRAALQDAVRLHKGWELLLNEAGWYSVLKLPSGVNEEALSLQLLKEDGVLVHPGYFFDFEQEGFLILSLLPEAESFKEGLRRILKRVSV